jgi:nucleoside-diphosphate kinase
MTERTLVILKPDAVKKNIAGEILGRFEKAGLRIAAIKKRLLTTQDAMTFYAVHKGKPFYEELALFMSEGPVIAVVLEGDNAISRARAIMGATNPANAAYGTIRKDFADSNQRNAVHGSDSPESVAIEIPFFFTPAEII